MNLHYIVIDGVIGVGKTTLTNLLAESYSGSTVFEIVEENPFLADFYQDPKRYAFQTQLFFLLSRYRQQQEMVQQELFSSVLISDYLFAKDKIFAHLTLEDRELMLYEKIMSSLEKDIVKPELVIYLKSSPDRLMTNIAKRGRPFEKDMSRDYIESLNQSYNQFFNHYRETRLLVINATELDFVQNKADYHFILNQIEKISC